MLAKENESQPQTESRSSSDSREKEQRRDDKREPSPDDKFVEKVEESYKPTPSELNFKDNSALEVKNVAPERICTPDNPTGRPQGPQPVLRPWNGKTNLPPKSIEQMQLEYARILHAPIAAVGTEIIDAAAPTTILRFLTTTFSYMKTSYSEPKDK